MLKQLAWNTFKNTGNIDTFMELVEVQNIEKKKRFRMVYSRYFVAAITF